MSANRPSVLVAHQPAYLPWIGYFARMRLSSTFVFLDDVQYEQGGWQNRNRILGSTREPQWLTVPVVTKHRSRQRILEVDCCDRWAESHCRSIRERYGQSPGFEAFGEPLLKMLRRRWTRLVDLNMELTKEITAWLGLRVTFERSSELGVAQSGTARLVALAERLDCDAIATGVGAQAYLDEGLLEREGLRHLPLGFHLDPYPQGRPYFVPGLSVVDLLFCSPATASEVVAHAIR